MRDSSRTVLPSPSPWKMIAYEFTTDQGEDLSAHEAFVTEFSNAVLDLDVQNVFALTRKHLQSFLIATSLIAV